MLTKLLNELKGRVDKLSENFNQEIGNVKIKIENIKENQSDMRTH